MGNAGATQMKVELDQASIDALAKAIGDALAKGATSGAKKINASLGAAGAQGGKIFSQKFSDSLKRLDKELVKALNDAMKGATGALGANIGKMVSGAQASLKTLSSVGERLTRDAALDLASKNTNARVHMGNVGKMAQTGATMGTAQLQSQLKQKAAETAKERAQIMADGRLKALAEANAGKLQVIAARRSADMATAEARQAGEMRVASHKAMLKTIVNIEKAIGAAVMGTARTLTSVVSRMTAGLSTVLGKATSSIAGIFRRSNSDTVDGLNGALNKRESIMRSSFSQQEEIVRKSTLRQREAMAAMQAQSSKGVLGAVTGRGAGMGLGALVGGAGIAAWLKGGYDEAVNLNEQLNKTKVVFGASSSEVIKFASNAVNAFGSTKAEALTAAATFGNLFRAIGLTEKQSAQMSTSMVQLAGDLSSFNNVPIEDAFAAIQSGLVGEQEPLRKFGVNLNEATLKAKAMELGLFKGKGVLTASAKAQAAYALILEQTTLAQGDFARTMNEGANAARRAGKSMKEMAAAIMGYVMPAVTVAMNALTTTFTAFTSIIRDQTNPIIHLFKAAIKGAVIALASMAALKGTIELFKLLGQAIRIAMGPMGLFLIAVGAVGAIVSVLMDRSKALRDSVKILGDRFKEIGKKISTAFAPYLASAGDLVNDTIIPAIDALASGLADVLIPAFDATASFVTKTVVPAIGALADLIVRDVVPKVVGLATHVAEMAKAAAGKIADFARQVRPLIQPLIDGFKILGEAIGAGLNGDWSKIGTGLGAAASGIAASAGNIGRAVVAALTPLAKRIWGMLLDVFSPDNLKRLAGGFLDLLYEVGRLVGSIATSPMLVKAVAALAAVAVIIGGKLVQGIASGIISNLPGLWNLLRQAVTKGLAALAKAAINNIGVVILAALGAFLYGPKLIGLFRKGGDGAGKSFGAGLKKSIGTSSQWLAGFFGGTGTLDARTKKDLQKQYQAISNEMKALGGSRLALGFQPISQDIVDRSKAQLEKLRSAFTDAERAGRLAAYKVGEQFKLAGGVIGGSASSISNSFKVAWKSVTGSIKGIQAALAATNAYTGAGTGGGAAFVKAFRLQTAGAGSALIASLKAPFAALTTYAQNTGQSVGKVLGNGIKSAASLAMAGIGGFMAGKAEGQSGGNGVFSAVTSGLTAGIATGNPIVGVAAAGMALYGAHMGKAEAAAKKLKQEVGALKDALKQNLIPALDGAQTSLKTFYQDMGGEGQRSFNESFLSSLPSGVKKAMDKANVSASDMIRAIQKGPEAFVPLLKSLNISGKDAYKLIMYADGVKKSIDEVNQSNRLLNDTDGLFGWMNKVQDVLPMLKDEAFNKQMEGAARKVHGVQLARENLDAKLSAPLPVPGLTDFQTALDNAIIGLNGVGAQVQALVDNKPKTLVDIEVNQAKLRTQQREISNTISATVNQGIKDGTIKTQADIDRTISAIVASAGAGGGKAAQDMITQWGNALKPGLYTLFSENSALNKDVRAAAERMGAHVALGLAYGINLQKGAVNSAVTGLSNGVIKQVKFAFQIASPSKVFKGFGKQLGAGLAIGIKQSTSHAVGAASRMADLVAAVGMPAMDTPDPALRSLNAARRAPSSQVAAQRVLSQSQTNNNHFYLPHGDPEAIALAVANRQASALFG